MDPIQALQRHLRARRKEQGLSTLVLPLTRGPIQGFFHYFTGYFLPLYWRRMHLPHERLTVMSVPSFDHWIELLPGERPKIIDQAKAMKHAVLRNKRGFSSHYRVEVVHYWDKWECFHERPLREIAEQVRADFADRKQTSPGPTPEIVLVGRAPIKRHADESFAGPSGNQKRSIPNLDELKAELNEEFSAEIIDGALTAPQQVIRRFESAQLIIGQHGAGLTNVFFSRPGSTLIEIVWQDLPPNSHFNIFALLCEELGIRWVRLALQDHPHDRIEPEGLLHEIRRLI